MAPHCDRDDERFEARTSHSVDTIELARVDAPLIVCDSRGRVLGCSSAAAALLARAGVDLRAPSPALPDELWSAITSHLPGEATLQVCGKPALTLSCTRAALGEDWLLVLREITHAQNELAYRLHQEHLASLGRLVATAVHDLRAPLSSIVFGIDVLARDGCTLAVDRTRTILSDLQVASSLLRDTIDCVLDFLRVGPPVPAAVSIKNVLSRTQSLLRPQMRGGPHRLLVEADHDVFVKGNLLSVEQIFVNLVVNALETAERPTTVRMTTSVDRERVRVLVADDGPAIAADQWHLLFEPMFSLKQHGVGLRLTSARDSARSVGGDVQLVHGPEGKAFAVLLPLCAAAGAR